YYFLYFNDPPPTKIYTLSLHDALPISRAFRAAKPAREYRMAEPRVRCELRFHGTSDRPCRQASRKSRWRRGGAQRRQIPLPWLRSEEHTSELQSRSDLVCRLLLEKKKK